VLQSGNDHAPRADVTLVWSDDPRIKRGGTAEHLITLGHQGQGLSEVSSAFLVDRSVPGSRPDPIGASLYGIRLEQLRTPRRNMTPKGLKKT